MPRARRRDEVARLEAELEAARPFLALAREISDDVARHHLDGGRAPRIDLGAVPGFSVYFPVPLARRPGQPLI